MKLITTLLPLAALTSAFVLPDEEMTSQMVLESQKEPQTFLDRIQGGIDNVWSEVEDTFKDAVALGESALDNAINAASETGSNIKNTFECHHSMTKFDTQGWLDSAVSTIEDIEIDWTDDHHGPPHHRPKRPHRGHPPHGHPPHKHLHPNKTVYELINESKYTTKLAKLINEYPDLVEALNGTAANYTVFAPTDKAFEKIPDHHKKPSKELIKKVLAYHVSADFYPAGRVLISHTIPTILGEDAIGGEAQRLRVGFGIPKGLNINFYSKIVAVNIFGTNGVIHGIDSLLLPPPPATTILSLLPGEFSTLLLGLEKTGLFEALKEAPHVGGTLFAPSNFAFKKLGPKINAFLFSSYGEKYLKALLKYHVVANQTLYSDAFYRSTDESHEEGIPKGHFHVDLPTLLDDKSLSIDIARYGGFISIKINGFSSVAVQDGIAKDGVIHVVSSILIPPKTPGAKSEEVEEEMDLEEFKERLETFYKEL
ncbi:related to Fasciclin domain family protein [Phialocephala subalpina]|uniref:Related to Fasciclin domain family protein n=1 Tax=Phialocephala subalpina TaxID=576137 RepID=A0A1L7WFS7_9HELO|nr:related to Fasciclin domain family protein [Phialocephala subalpina]